jgi:cold shock protein
MKYDEYQRRAANVRVEVRRTRGRREMSDAAQSPEKLLGEVKWYNESRGFGFIEPKGGGPDVFMHVSALKKAGLSEIKERDPVRFRVETTKRGQQACDIELVIG